jgi:hypothetical protein
MVAVPEAVCTGNKTAFENTNLSVRTTVRRVEEMTSALIG